MIEIAPGLFRTACFFVHASVWVGIGVRSDAIAQLIPDGTLGGNGSQVIRNVDIGGELGTRVNGGVVRGGNLFHSFQEFNIRDGQRLYFSDPVGVDAIITRVTGGDRSNIAGTLGVDGTADLFLLNPNGIVFGPNARLDLRGSFIATTANALRFGDQGMFRATNPNLPPLLTVAPSAFWFTQMTPQPIVNRSVAPDLGNPLGQDGLEVARGENLLLVGGNIRLDQGRLQALGGHIALAGVSEPGQIQLQRVGNRLTLGVPEQANRANIWMTDEAAINVAASGGGSVSLQAQNLTLLQGSVILAGIAEGLGAQGSLAGDVEIDATGRIRLGAIAPAQPANGIFNLVGTGSQGDAGNISIRARSLEILGNSTLGSSTFGLGNAGRVEIEAIDQVVMRGSGSGLFSATFFAGVGNGGGIRLQARSLSMRDGAQILTSTISQGNAGNIAIDVADDVILESGALIRADTFGRGNAGTITVRSGGTLSMDGVGANDVSTGILSIVSAFEGLEGIGNGGNVRIWADNLSLTNGGQINTSTFGQGDAGNVMIRVDDRVALRGLGRTFASSGIFSVVGETPFIDTTAPRQGGSIHIRAGSVSMRGGGQIASSTASRGDAGDVNLRVEGAIALDGIRRGFPSSIQSNVESGAQGNGGEVRIRADSLTLTNAAQLQTGVREGNELLPPGRGNAGTVDVRVRDALVIDGIAETVGLDGKRRTFSSLISSTLSFGAVGRAGTVQVQAGTMQLTDGGQIASSTYGQGDAGEVRVRVDGAIAMDGVEQGLGSGILTNVEAGGVGDGGTIRIWAENLTLRGGAQMQTLVREASGPFPAGQGQAGNVILHIDDTLAISGVGASQFPDGTRAFFPSLIASSLNPGATGRAGDIEIDAGSVWVTNGGQILSSTAGVGDAGNLDIVVQDDLLLFGVKFRQFDSFSSLLSTEVTESAIGNGGDIRVRADSLTLSDYSFMTTSSAGQGDAGNVSVRVNDAVTLDYLSGIRSGIEPGGRGRGGNVEISGRSLSIRNGAQIGTLLFRSGSDAGGRGRGGNITLDIADQVNISGYSKIQLPVIDPFNPSQILPTIGRSSGLFASTERGARGAAGNITVRTGDFRIHNGAVVNALTANQGSGGSISIHADTFSARRGGQVITTTRDRGQAGDIELIVSDRLLLTGFDPNFGDRIVLGEDLVNNQGAESGLFANTAAGSRGNGGNIFVDPPQVALTDHARITVDSQGSGEGGNIELRAGTLRLENDALISAETSSNTGGDVLLQVDDLVVLRHGSNISTEAGTARAGGDGGNIIINTPFVVAVPEEDSNIRADAFEGNGGSIDITTQGIYGIEFRPQETPLSDITASSQFGLAGTVVINRPDVDPSRGLAELSAEIVDASQQIAQECSSGSQAGDRLGEFVVTGRGGLPPSPSELLSPDDLLTDWVTPAQTEPVAVEVSSAVSPPLVPEAQGWVMTAEGVTLVSQATTSGGDFATHPCQ